MSSIKVNTSRSNVTTHRAVLDQDQILEMLSKAVAAESRVDLRHSAVSVRCYITSRDSSVGPRKEAVVEITVDHSAQPSVAETES